MKIGAEEAFERLIAAPGTVIVLGTIDTGKTSFAIELVRRAVERGLAAAFVDADIDQSTVGPPGTVGLKLCTGMTQMDAETLRVADALGFVGSLNPRGHLLPLVASAQKLVVKAREAGCRLVVVDTTGFVSGIYGQSLNYFLMDGAAPDTVLAFERGGELEPLVGQQRVR